MKRSQFSFLVLVAAMNACHHRAVTPPVAGLTIRVVTAADTTARIATVRLRHTADAPPVPLSQSADGRFHGALPAQTERMVLTVAVPEHVSITTAFWLPNDLTGELVIRPQALIPRRTIATVRVVGDFNGFNDDSALVMKGTGDGRLRAAVPFHGDSARFNVLGLGGGSRGAWMPVASWALVENEYGAPHYAGVLRPVRDTLFFEVDTTAARRLPAAAAITFTTRDTALVTANRIMLDRAFATRISDPLSWWEPASGEPPFGAVRSPIIARAREVLALASDGRVRQEAVTSIVELSPLSMDSARALGALYFAIVPPGSPATRDNDGVKAMSRALVGLWPDSTATPDAQERAERLIVERTRAYVLPVARMSGDSSARTNAWLTAASRLKGLRDTAALFSVIDEAVAAMPTNPFVAKLPSAMGRDRVLRTGALFPAFRMTSIGAGAEEITNAAFQGKLTLVDIWGTWCAPCVGEMPTLHKAYERFKDRGFMIVSIAADESVADVVRFRKNKFPMPWLNAWAGGQAVDTPTMKALGVMSLPMAVLVDASGRIVAVDEGLRGADLETTLGRLLK
jgi:thiol-disulfide isomerase/thioredoxin